MTTSKRDSHDKARRAGSQPNLGQKLTGENRGSGWIDTTGESVKRAKARLVARIPSDRKRLGHDLETITLSSTPAMALTRLRRRSDPPAPRSANTGHLGSGMPRSPSARGS
jgi:hypothetical protein